LYNDPTTSVFASIDINKKEIINVPTRTNPTRVLESSPPSLEEVKKNITFYLQSLHVALGRHFLNAFHYESEIHYRFKRRIGWSSL
jgi:hypothetical protein